MKDEVKVEDSAGWSELEPKEQMFVRAYLKHFVAGRAHKEAGYDGASHYELGSKMLERPQINRVIREFLDKSGLTFEQIVISLREMAADAARGVASVIEGNKSLEKAIDCGDIPSGAIKSYSISEKGAKRIELQDRRQVLMDLAKLHGHVIEKVEQKGSADIHVLFNDLSPADALKMADAIAAEERNN